MLRTLICLSLIVACAIPVFAADLVYGSGTLPKLAIDAKIVVESKSGTLVAENPKAVIYSITFGTSWKGVPAGPMHVLCPLAEGAPKTEDLKDAALFLRGPLSAKQRQYWGVPPDLGDVYQIVSARHGVVSIAGIENGVDTSKRRFALQTYLSAADGPAGQDARLKWAERNVKSNDVFLQESALFEVERQPESGTTLKTLSTAIDGKTTSTTKALALRIVGDTETAEAIKILMRAATNSKLPIPIRRQALVELIERHDAAEAVEKLVNRGDRFVTAMVHDIRNAM